MPQLAALAYVFGNATAVDWPHGGDYPYPWSLRRRQVLCISGLLSLAASVDRGPAAWSALIGLHKKAGSCESLTMSLADWYHYKAAQCLRLAKTAGDPRVLAGLKSERKTWLELAAAVEKDDNLRSVESQGDEP